MTLEENILNEKEKEELRKRSEADFEELSIGRTIKLNGRKIRPSDEGFFQEVVDTIPKTKAALAKVEPEQIRIAMLVEETKQKIEQLKRVLENKAAHIQNQTAESKVNGSKNPENNQKSDIDYEKLDLLEQDLTFYRAASAELPIIKKQIRSDLDNLEGILAHGERRSWSAMVEFELQPTPSVRAKEELAHQPKKVQASVNEETQEAPMIMTEKMKILRGVGNLENPPLVAKPMRINQPIKGNKNEERNLPKSPANQNIDHMLKQQKLKKRFSSING